MYGVTRSNALPSSTNHSSSKGKANGIMYQSRMRYLKSREGSRKSLMKQTSTRNLFTGERRSTMSSSSSSTNSTTLPPKLLGASHIPCSAEKLLPPQELMTRERSYRHVYWKHHHFPNIQKLECLQMKEDPKVKKKRESILARIHAAELSSERARKDRSMRRKAEEEAKKKNANDGGDMMVPSDQSVSGNTDESYSNEDFSRRDDPTNNSTTIRRTTKLRRRYSMENPLTHLKGGIRRNSGTLDDESDEKEGYGDSFSFLSEWCAAEKSKKKKKNNLIALTKQGNSGIFR